MSTTTAVHSPHWVTDGGMETDLIFHHGVALPHFAAFPLIEEERGRRLLADYYAGYADVAAAAGAGLMLESPTWRANPDWGARLGYGPVELHAANVAAIAFLRGLARRYRDLGTPVRISGMVGPRGDGYAVGAHIDPDEACAYHRPQLEAFAEAGVDVATAYTLTDTGEAIGIVLAARAVGLAVGISFTVGTDGRLLDGTTVAQSIRTLDQEAPPDHFLLNCAHPRHIAAGVAGMADAALSKEMAVRITGLRYNASTRSHEELDDAAELDEGNPADLKTAHDNLSSSFPALEILGGCCGTDARHVAALWSGLSARDDEQYS
ncbi:MAG: homocysteine S-methyltransferase family protein [Arachnia sp.]